MPKTDFKKTLDCYKAKSGGFRLLEVPALAYLMVDGNGDPNTSDSWANAISSLYPLAFSLKFMSKNELDRDYVVMPLEALWWSEDMAAFTTTRDKSLWNWTAMIMVPDWTTPGMLDRAIEKAAAKNLGLDFGRVRLETMTEGLSVQTLHVGAYDDEGPILQQLHSVFAPDHALTITGKHHEIYLSDARSVEQFRLKTILRQPVEAS